MKNTHIQWCDHTFNPWIGCTKVAPECKNCYAEERDKRFADGKHWGKGAPRQRTSASNWKQPLSWNREAEKAGVQARVFCASLSDWLDDEVPLEWLRDLLDLIRRTPHLNWLLLTKRPQNFLGRVIPASYDGNTQDDLYLWVSDWMHNIRVPHNIWLGVSAGVDPVPILQINAPVHFLSCEPMLSPMPLTSLNVEKLFNWIIFGGESGRNARRNTVLSRKRNFSVCKATWIECHASWWTDF
jgi:protein gp37